MYPSDCCSPPPGCQCGRPCCPPPWRRDAPPPGQAQWGGHPPQPPEHWGSNFNVLRNKWSNHAMRGVQGADQVMPRRTASQATCYPCCSWTDTDLSCFDQSESSNDCDNFSVREIPMRPAPPCPSYDEIPVRDCCEPPVRDPCYCDPPKKCVSWKPNVMLIETWRSKSNADSSTRKCFEGNTSNMSVEVCYCDKTDGECVCKKKEEPTCLCNDPSEGCRAENQSACATHTRSVTRMPTMRTRMCRKPSVQYMSACEPMGKCMCGPPSQSSCSCCEHVHSTCSREKPPIRCSCDKPIWSCLCIQPPSQLLEKCLCGESKNACRCDENKTITRGCFCGKPRGLCQCRKSDEPTPRRSPCNKPISTCTWKEPSTKPLVECLCGKPIGICVCFKPPMKPLQGCSCGRTNSHCACRVTSEKTDERRRPSCSCQSHKSSQAPRRTETNLSPQPNQASRFREETFSTADLKKTNNNESQNSRNNKRNTSPDQKQRHVSENIPTNRTKRSSIAQSERFISKARDSLNLKYYATDENSRSDLVLDDGFRYPRSAQKRERMNWQETDRWVKNHGARYQGRRGVEEDGMVDGSESVQDRERSSWDRSSMMYNRDSGDVKAAGAWPEQPRACYCGVQEKQRTGCCHSSPPASRCSSINIRIATRNNTCTCNTDEPELDGLFISLRPCDCIRPPPCKCLLEQEVYTDDNSQSEPVRDSAPQPVRDSQPQPVEVSQCPCTVKKKKREEANKLPVGEDSLKDESICDKVNPDEEYSRIRSEDVPITSPGAGPAHDFPVESSINTDDKKKEKQITFDEGQISVGKTERIKKKGRVPSKCGCSGKGRSKSRSARSKSKKSGVVKDKKNKRKKNRTRDRISSNKSTKNYDTRSISEDGSSGSDGTSEKLKIRGKTGRSRSRKRGGCKCAKKENIMEKMCHSFSRTKIRSQEKLKKCSESLKKRCSLKRRGNKCRCSSGASNEPSRSQNTRTGVDNKAVVLYSSGFHGNKAFETNDHASDGMRMNGRNKDGKNKNRGQQKNDGFKSKFSFGPFFSNMWK